MGDHCFDEVDDAREVIVVVFYGVLNRFPNIDESGKVHDDVDFFGVEYFADEFFVFEVALIELYALF